MQPPHERAGQAPLGDPPTPPFPPEAGWLEFEPPPLGEDFVGRTLALLKHQGLVATTAAADRDDDGDRDGDLPGELLAQYRAPSASRNFVARTLQATQRDRADQWRRLLLRYDAPDPTPDFVARTLAALRAATPTAAIGRPRRFALALLAAAAAAVLMFLLRPDRPAHALRQLLADAAPSTAVAHSPSVLSHLLANRTATEQDAVPLAAANSAADGGWLWLAAAEDRR